MAISQGKSTRKSTGGRYIANRGKRKSELGREPANTRLDERKLRKIRTRGGSEKVRLASDNKINLMNPDSNKAETAEIITVLENSADPNYVRRNIITKGAIVETNAGKARITSRPGQDGILNGVLINE
ncbi:30S ribosomal protein S8e [Candidatus Methanobinarius endosymbioticus]|uniref:Small ribosomal subunit protein eS8 n=1 Tax=Candidatus Methanobinarius endosymbioticus TaxID=2006182 RepID=A0A366MB07_9EURY|nr:30S ribosomal protein S8e [Candidatus Methanobinarius endosymbioticus]